MRSPDKRRNKQLNIGLTEHEHSTVLERAARVGMKPVDFGRWKLLGNSAAPGTAQRAGHHLDPLFLLQLSKLGNNLNQLVRLVHQGVVDAPAALQPLLREILDLIRKGAADDS